MTSNGTIVSGMQESALRALKTLLGARATTNDVERDHRSHGESYHSSGLPDVVCFPQSAEEVSEIVKITALYGLPVVPFGAGTSLEGHVKALRGGISVDLSQMNKISELLPGALEERSSRS